MTKTIVVLLLDNRLVAIVVYSAEINTGKRINDQSGTENKLNNDFDTRTYHLVKVWLGIWISGSLDFCPLDCLTVNVVRQERFASQEQFVIVPSRIGSPREPLERI